MRKIFKKFWLLVCVTMFAALCLLTGCGEQNKASISFKDTMVSYVTMNTTLNVSEYLEYTEGYDVELKAEYAGGSYKTYGLSFMPTELGEVTLTASLKGTKAKATTTVEVRIAPPKVMSENECIRYRGEAFEIDSLKEALNVVAKNDEYTFKAISATLLGGDEVISFDGLTEYTFANVGNYEIAYELSNAGGTTEGTFVLWVKRVLTDNEINDISNYGQGIFSKDSATVTVDETEKAENSDWCFVVKADPAATGKSDTDYTQNYWTNYAHLQIEDGISLSEKYLELDLQFSADSRDLMIFQFVDAGFTQSSVDYVVRAVDGRPWQHVSFKDVYKYGNYEYLRIIVLHPQTSDLESYNAANVWVKVDNVTLHEYDVPYEYNEPITYTYTENDYTASEGFEEAKMLWSDLANSKNYTSIIQVGEYANEETEFNFTLKDAGIGAYEFAIGARVDNDDPMKGVFVEFKRDAGNAFFNVWGTSLAGQWIDAQTLFFADGHNYTVRLAVDGATLKMVIIDNTTEQTIVKYEKDLSASVMGETGGFIFTTRKDVEVACMKPHAIIVEQEVKETTISNITIGDANTPSYIHLNIGSGQFPAGIISTSNNLAYAEGTFSQGATWTTAADELKFKGNVGVLADTATTLQVFPTGTTPSIGDKLNIPQGSTIIVGEYKTTFGEEVNFWFNGETWQAEEVAPETPPVNPDEPEQPEEPTVTVISGVVIGEWCASTSSASQLRLNATSNNVPTTIVNWNSQLGIAGVSSMYGAGDVTWFAMDISPAATVGTAITIPTKEFVVDGVTYKFDQEYTFYFDGTAWGTEFVAVPEEPEVPAVTVISGVIIGEWCASTSSANQLRVNATSENIPTLVVNWNKQLGIVGVNSMYGGGADWFAMDLDPAATVGTAITIPTTEFVVDGMTYKFDQEYTFYFDGTAWGTDYVATPIAPVVISGVVIGEWCAEYSTANQLRVNAISNNIPTTVVNWNKQLGIVGVSSMYGGGADWFAMDLSPAATVGTAITIPTTEFVVDGVTYKFDQEYTFYFDGTAWGTEFVAVPEEPEVPAVTVISELTVRPSQNQTASLAYINVASNNVPVPNPAENWNKQLGIAGVASMYGGTSEWFAFELSTPATVGTVVVLPADKEFTVEGKAYKFDKEYSIYFDGSVWTMEFVAVPEEPSEPKEVTIKNITLGENKAIGHVTLVIGEGTLQSAVVGSTSNWSSCDTFGKVAKIGEHTFYAVCGVLANGANGIVLFPTAQYVTEGVKLNIPVNATVTVGEYSVIFGEEVNLWFNGETWQAEEYVVTPPVTPDPEEPAGNVISGLSISTWTTSNATSLYINVTSNNIPTTVVNWVWTGAGGSQSEFGSAVFSNKTNISSNISIYGGGADFFIATALDAVAGSKLVIPGNKIFTVDGKDYTFDQDYTFYFDGTTWSTSEYVAPTATATISQLSISSMSKPAQIYVKVASNNVPTTVVNWIWTGEIVDGKKTLSEFGKDAISGAASIYGYQSNYFIVEPHVEPTEGTQIKLPGQKKFTVDGVDYMFDRDYTFTYSNGTWTVA